MNNASVLRTYLKGVLSLLLPLLAGIVLGCDTSSSQPPLKPNLLTAGASWTYDVHFTKRPLDSSTIDTILTTSIRMAVTETNVKIGTRSGLIELKSFAASDPDRNERNWYQQSADSLVEVAATFTEIGTPLSSKAAALKPRHVRRGPMGLPVLVRQRLNQSSPHSTEASGDTLIHEDSRIVLQTPLTQGATWTSFRKPLIYTRTVAGSTPMGTPAGLFNATKVKSNFLDFTLDFHWVDYYTADGLIRRVVADTTRRRNAEGEDLGRFVFREVYNLTDFKH